MIFWGLTKEPINYEFVLSPIFFLICMGSTLLLMLLYSKFLFSSKTDENIFLATALIGNTGNLGIPLGIALFGVESVPYTSIINIANILFIYIFSVYFFAREQFLLKEAIFAILKIPAIWFTLFALFALRNPVELTLRQKKFLIILLAFLFFLFAYFSLNFISGDI